MLIVRTLRTDDYFRFVDHPAGIAAFAAGQGTSQNPVLDSFQLPTTRPEAAVGGRHTTCDHVFTLLITRRRHSWVGNI
ncbi:MAG TPA: hypothetical protein VNO32_07185 [Candidatus Acidoferrum sp.]|jgi:hypothetical protein|nr:hypothetical protein [Candidatus Acidoferrum sp.]